MPTIFLLPWLPLAQPAKALGFRFVPLRRSDVASYVDAPFVPIVQSLLDCYVDSNRKPVRDFALALRARHSVPWDIPDRLFKTLHQAVDILMMAFLSEQQFLVPNGFAASMNSAMFELVGQRLVTGSQHLSIEYRKRGGGVLAGGMQFKDVQFQKPVQTEYTSCGVFNAGLVRALERLHRSGHDRLAPILDAIAAFKIGHSEAPYQTWEEACFFSAVAFERLLGPSGKQATGLGIASNLNSTLQHPNPIPIRRSRRIKPDASKHSAEQADWSIHKKWMKELYELRNSVAHHGTKAELSTNWSPAQHVVIAAFVFPLTLKRVLCDIGLYTMSDGDLGSIDALDALLDSEMRGSVSRPPKWASILSDYRSRREIGRIVSDALAKES